MARQLRHQLDDLAQRVDPGTAEFIGLTGAGTAAQAAPQRLDHIVDQDRLESCVRSRQGKDEWNGGQQRREAIEKRVAGTEHYRGLENGPIEMRAAFAD